MEERELPVGWATAQVGEVCRLLNGRAYSKSELLETGKYRVLRVGNLFTNPHWYHSDLELDDDKYCQAGDLLYAWSASFGPHVWKGEKVIYHYHIWKVEHDENLIDRDFLKAFFHWDTNRIKQQQGSGSTMLHVTKKSMEERAIPVPPTSEQRRIAAKLDTTLAAVDACRERLDGVAELLKHFRQAVLAAATSGELTREWREERGLNWAPHDTSIRDLGKVITGNTPPANKEESDEQFPLFKPSDLDSGYKVCTARELMGPVRAQCSRLLPPMSVLVTCIGATVGKTGLARVAGATNQQINAVICDSSVAIPEWVYFWLASPCGQSAVIGNASATTLPIINKSRFSALMLKVPSVNEQQEIVRCVEDLFTLADQLEARLNAARKVVDRLTPALLAKAFRGELVPQDPTDESVSVLLERIRAARQAEAGAGKISRRGRPKAAANPAPINRNAAPAPSEPLPPDLLTQLLRECGALSERALLAVSELEPERFEQQLFRELEKGTAREVQANGQVLLEAVG